MSKEKKSSVIPITFHEVDNLKNYYMSGKVEGIKTAIAWLHANNAKPLADLMEGQLSAEMKLPIGFES